MIFTLAVIIFFFDQFTKLIVIKFLQSNQSLPVIKGVLYLSLVHNRGAAFGIFKNQTLIFIIAAGFAISLIASSLRKSSKANLYNFALSLILAGSAGNLIDRLRFGYVIDFIDFRVWPVFNIADSAITIGAILLGYSMLFNKTPDSKLPTPN